MTTMTMAVRVSDLNFEPNGVACPSDRLGSAAFRAVRLSLTGVTLQSFREAKPRESYLNSRPVSQRLTARNVAQPPANI